VNELLHAKEINQFMNVLAFHCYPAFHCCCAK